LHRQMAAEHDAIHITFWSADWTPQANRLNVRQSDG
jgi:hypothetical protein